MTPLPNVPDVVEVRMGFNTGPSLNSGIRFFLQYEGGPPSTSDLATLAADIEGLFASHLASLLTLDSYLSTVQLTDLNSSSGARGTWSGVSGGSRTGNMPTLATATNIAFSIARRYRGGKPRVMPPFGVTTDLSEGNSATWTAAYVTEATTKWDTFMTDVVALSGSAVSFTAQVNVSYYEGFTVETDPSTGRSRNVPKLRSSPLVQEITTTQVKSLIGAQRRRRLASSTF